MTTEFFYRRKSYGVDHDRFDSYCRPCRAATSEARRQKLRADPEKVEEFVARTKAARRKWSDRHIQRIATDPAYRRRYNENQRLKDRLRAEQAGRPLPPVRKVADEDATGGLLPARPVAEFVQRCMDAERRALNGHAEGIDIAARVCEGFTIDPRNLYAWIHGERKSIRFDVADRILVSAQVNWWDVYDADRWPEAHKRAAELFEGQVAA